MDQQMFLDQSIKPISINDEMKNSFLEYAMSVIVSRALPEFNKFYNTQNCEGKRRSSAS